MLKLEKFDGKKTYMFPDGSIATPERIRAQFPAVDIFPFVIEANGEVCQAVINLSALRGINNIDEALTEAEAIGAIEVIINTAPVADDVPAAEERIASAMEYQIIASM